MNGRYCNGMVHVIQKGDTLYQLSRKYRIPLAILLRANPYIDVYNLQEGQEICIPMVRANGMICVPAQGMMQPRNEPMQPEGQEDTPEDVMQQEDKPWEEEREMEMRKDDDDDKEDDDDVEIYVTSGGKTLGDILNEYGVNWEDFVKNNNLSQIVLGDDVVLYFPKKKAR